MDLARLNALINQAGTALSDANAALVEIQKLHDAEPPPAPSAPVAPPPVSTGSTVPTGDLHIKAPDLAPLTGPALDAMRWVQGHSTAPSGTDAWNAMVAALAAQGITDPQQVINYVTAYGPGGSLAANL